MTSSANPHDLLSRRSFLAKAAVAAASVSVTPAAFASCDPPSSVTITGHDTLPDVLSPGLTLTTRGRTASYPTHHIPVGLALHPKHRVLYTASIGPDPGLLTAYTVDPADLTLRPFSAQPLSLAAAHPRSIHLTPNAKSLITLDAHGLLNVHPLLPDGAIAPIEHVRRLTGSPAIAGSLPRPTSLLLHSGGSVALILDPACRRILPVALGEPYGPTLLDAADLPGGFTPSNIAVAPAGDYVAVTSGTSSYLAILRFTPEPPHVEVRSATYHALPPDHLPRSVHFSPDGARLTVTVATPSQHLRHTYLRVGAHLDRVHSRPVPPLPPTQNVVTFKI